MANTNVYSRMLPEYYYKESFFGQDTPLPEAAGYAIVLGLGSSLSRSDRGYMCTMSKLIITTIRIGVVGYYLHSSIYYNY